MDPNTALANMRAAIAEYRRVDAERESGLATFARLAEIGAEIAESADALDGWVSRGGFLPSAWQR